MDEKKEEVIETKDNETKTDDKGGEDKKEVKQDDTVVLSRAEYETLLNKSNNIDAQLEETNTELKSIKCTLKMDELGIDKKYQEDVFALIKGKGLEVSTDTIQAEAEKHPEWKKKVVANGVEVLGQPGEDKKPDTEEIERKQARKLFGLN